jgi:exodeoxyribonuclease VII large subunit
MGRRTKTNQTTFDFEAATSSLLSGFSDSSVDLTSDFKAKGNDDLKIEDKKADSKNTNLLVDPIVQTASHQNLSKSLPNLVQSLMAKASDERTAPAQKFLDPIAKLDFSVGDQAAPKAQSSPKSTAASLSDEPLESQAESEDALAQSEPKVLSVSDLNSAIKDLLEGQFALTWVRGEISNFKIPPSGHFYFTLKDSKAQVRAVMFKGHSSKLTFEPEDGMEVIVRARVSVYAPRGDYQIMCEMMEPVGMGALQIAFEQLKKKLEAEGLFAASKKRALPTLPKRIAIVTSPTGAAIRDMLNVLSRRFKGAEVTLIPTSVQGTQATKEIIKAIQMANAVVPAFDVMIVGRGGGSIEDLWCFNEEGVARAIAASKIPTVSAVGHEIDFTIADFVADLRAPTPSAAAELVVKNAADLSDRIKLFERRLRSNVINKLSQIRLKIKSTEKRLIDPRRRLLELIQRCDELVQRLERGMQRQTDDLKRRVESLRLRLGRPDQKLNYAKENLAQFHQRLLNSMREKSKGLRTELEHQMALLDSFSPLKVVDRGYSIVNKESKVIKSFDQIKVGDKVKVRLSKGSFEAKVINTSKNDETGVRG